MRGMGRENISRESKTLASSSPSLKIMDGGLCS